VETNGRHGGAENAGVENEGVEYALDEKYEASPATTSESSESPETAVAATDECCEVCLVASCEGFALVPCGHAGICKNCAVLIADLDSYCPVCRAPIRMVMRVFSSFHELMQSRGVRRASVRL